MTSWARWFRYAHCSQSISLYQIDFSNKLVLLLRTDVFKYATNMLFHFLLFLFLFLDAFFWHLVYVYPELNICYKVQSSFISFSRHSIRFVRNVCWCETILQSFRLLFLYLPFHLGLVHNDSVFIMFLMLALVLLLLLLVRNDTIYLFLPFS